MGKAGVYSSRGKNSGRRLIFRLPRRGARRFNLCVNVPLSLFSLSRDELQQLVVQLLGKRCGRDGLDCWLGGEPGLLALDAQALHAVFLVGDDLSGKR